MNRKKKPQPPKTKKKPAKTIQEKPAQGKKRGPGRITGGGYHPTPEQRAMVKAAAGYRMPLDEIALVIINPQTKRSISKVTLLKHFRDEIDTGYAHLRSRIMAASVRSALGVLKEDKDGNVVVEQQGNVTAQIWLQKTLYGARESVDVTPPPPVKTEDDENTLDAARRVAFTMALGARIIKEQKPAKPKR